MPELARLLMRRSRSMAAVASVTLFVAGCGQGSGSTGGSGAGATGDAGTGGGTGGTGGGSSSGTGTGSGSSGGAGGGAGSGGADAGAIGTVGPDGGPSGMVTSTTMPFPMGLTNACENPWTMLLLRWDPTPRVPRRMYYASCTTPSGTPKMFVSETLTSSTVISASEDKFAGNSGAVFEADWQEGKGLVPTGVAHAFPECREMHGIAAKSDCSVVGVLCRRVTGSSQKDPPTKDMVASISDTAFRSWITQPVSADGKTMNDEEWLYEWPKGDITAAPDRYVAHKAIGSWEFGSKTLVYGETDDTYGLSLKATVFGPDGSGKLNESHEGDALLVVNRSTYDIDTKRGWDWGCGAGHTIFNHLAYNPATSQYAVTCTTDLGIDATNNGGYAGVWFHPEQGGGKGVADEPLDPGGTGSFGGGTTSLQPLPDGGFIGTILGSAAPVTPNENILTAYSSVGLIRYDKNDKPVGGIQWVAQEPGRFLSYPQLAPLGDGTFLLGYAEMRSDERYFPDQFRVVQIDQTGKLLGPVQTVPHAGWGEQDQLIPLGAGRVGWAYIPSPTTTAGSPDPACLSPSLQLSAYVKQ